jgi:transposase-like protein
MERTLSLNAVAKRYDEAFKRQAVEMVLQGGKTVREVAENLGVSQYSIFPLVAMPGSMGKGSGSAGLPEDVEGLQKLVREQQRQIADLTQTPAVQPLRVRRRS